MKIRQSMSNRIMMLLASFVIIIASCKEHNITDMGSSIQPSEDKIFVSSERFDIISENYFVNSMYSRADSFLLGTFYDEQYGTVHADILAQVEHPKNHTYQPNITPDSILLVLHYRKYFGDKYSPAHVSVYEMNKTTFNYSTPYASDLNPDDYVDKTNKALLIGEKTFTAGKANKVGDSTIVTVKLSDEFMRRFTSAPPSVYTDDSLFLDFFKGLYITTDFGSASMLYVRQIYMEYFHSYVYTTKGLSGEDSIAKVNVSVVFPANSRVRQINRFFHPDKSGIISGLESQPKQIHHVSSPANVYTRVKLPIGKMHEKIESDDARLAINNAVLRVDIDKLNEGPHAQPIPSHLLLIKESSLERFFTKRELPADSCAILGTYLSGKNKETGKTDNFYSFNIAGLIAHHFKQARKNKVAVPESLDFLLVPVRVKANASTGVVTEVSQQFILNAVTICGGNHPERPIKADVIFSRF